MLLPFLNIFLFPRPLLLDCISTHTQPMLLLLLLLLLLLEKYVVHHLVTYLLHGRGAQHSTARACIPTEKRNLVYGLHAHAR
jgi:hypothetical protein